MALGLVIGLLAARSAPAGFTLGANSGGITFSVKPVNAGGGGAAVFGANGELLDPGMGYPSLGAALAPGPQNIGGGIAAPAAGINPPLGLSGVANPALAGPAGQFGGGSTNLVATTFGGGGAAVIWRRAFVFDPLTNGTASVNESRGRATFTNNQVFSGTAGVALGIQGQVSGVAGSFVAAALWATLSIVDPNNNVTNIGPLSVVIASDGAGALADFVNVTSPGPQFSAFLGGGLNTFAAWGVGLSNRIVNIPANSTYRLDGTLTLIADPGAGIELDLSLIPPDVPRGDLGAAAIPEPSTIVLSGCGLVLTVVWLSRRKPRAAPRAADSDGPPL